MSPSPTAPLAEHEENRPAASDPRDGARPWYARWAAPLLNDPRDVTFVALMMQCCAFAAAGVALFFAGPLFWYLAPIYWAVFLLSLLDRFTLMLHCSSHRQLFRPQYGFLNHVIPWLLGPFLGQIPETYFAHHMGMHHVEENLSSDLSSTMRFRRDRFGDWLRYYLRFLVLGLFELCRYFARRRRWRLLRRVLVGEGAYWVAMVALLLLNPAATLVVFVGPLLLMRTVMMMGNWAQHAFICQEQPENPYRASITCINTRYNRRGFNDGYHALHHMQPRCHWTEHPAEYQRALAEYGRQDAVVLDGIDFFQVWILLMRRRWKQLAQAFVRLPGAPERSEAEVIDFLRQRARPFATAGGSRVPVGIGAAPAPAPAVD